MGLKYPMKQSQILQTGPWDRRRSGIAEHTEQERPLKKFYAFLFVDCLYVSVRHEMETKNCAVYVILGYDVDGSKDILGIWIGGIEGKHYWMHIFDEIKARGVEDVLFISMDGVSGLEEGAKSIFKDVVVLLLCGHSQVLWHRYPLSSDKIYAQIDGFHESVQAGGRNTLL